MTARGPGTETNARDDQAPPAPLADVGVAVTRASADAATLAAALRALGAEVVLTPLVRIEPLAPEGAEPEALAGVAAYDWVAVTSRHAVEELARALAADGAAPAAALPPLPPVAAVGAATADAARALGWRVTVVPARHDAASLAQAMRDAGELRGARVLFPRARDARETLPAALRDAGATVDEVTLYRTVPDAEGAAALRERLQRHEVAVVTLASGSAARALAEYVGVALAAHAALVSIGPTTSAVARALGLSLTTEADEASVAGLVAAVARAAGSGTDDVGLIRAASVMPAVDEES